MYNWTKKYESISWWDFFKLVQEMKSKYKTNDKVLYFKIVVKCDGYTDEERSNLKDN